MLNSIVGNVDWPAAVVLVGLFVSIGIGFVVYRTKPRKTKEDYEIEKLEVQSKANNYAYQSETNRLTEMAKLEKNLITSHKEV